MAYLYETHLHTCQGSGCGTSTGREHARFYKDIGFTGIFVTDHFFGGNTAVPANLPWKERIDWFCSGYEDALAEGQRIGLDVFFGWEQGYGDDEYLVYGLDKQWLLAHPEVEHWTRREQLEGVRRAGGCVVQAHPFRTRDYIEKVRIALGLCDGVEAANAGNHAYNDAYAMQYARTYDLPVIAGSDNHKSVPGMEKDRIFGVALDTPLASAQDFARRITNRAKITLNVPEGRFSPEGCPEIETFFFGDHEQLIPTGRTRVDDWAAE